MSIKDWFKPKEQQKIMSREEKWQELGTYKARFTSFGTNLYQSDLIRSCIRPLAEHTSKANAVCKDKMIERILNVKPNIYMNGKDFLSKIRTRLELINTVFILIIRDETGKPIEFYPVPYSSFEAIEYKERLFVQFHFTNHKTLVAPWDDLVALRKDYNESDIAGDSNNAILPMIDLIGTTKQGIGHAVKSTANLRGILKNTKAMMSPEDIKKSKDTFVKDYLSLENEGGIACIDAMTEFTPISMNPTVTNWETLKEFREDVYRYYGVSDAIVMSSFTESQMEAFYESRIEPFLVALSTELTRKCFTDRELGFGAYITYESNRIQYASISTKLNMVQLVDRGALTPNEWRKIFNLAPIDGGDEPIRRLDTQVINDNNIQKQEEANND